MALSFLSYYLSEDEVLLFPNAELKSRVPSRVIQMCSDTIRTVWENGSQMLDRC